MRLYLNFWREDIGMRPVQPKHYTTSEFYRAKNIAINISEAFGDTDPN